MQRAGFAAEISSRVGQATVHGQVDRIPAKEFAFSVNQVKIRAVSHPFARRLRPGTTRRAEQLTVGRIETNFDGARVSPAYRGRAETAGIATGNRVRIGDQRHIVCWRAARVADLAVEPTVRRKYRIVNITHQVVGVNCMDHHVENRLRSVSPIDHEFRIVAVLADLDFCVATAMYGQLAMAAIAGISRHDIAGHRLGCARGHEIFHVVVDITALDTDVDELFTEITPR